MEKLKIIYERRKNRIGKSEIPIENFLTKWNYASRLLEEIDKKIKDEKLCQEARRQHIISMITALEGYLRDRFIDLIDTYKLDYENVGKETKKFTLSQIEYIMKKNLSMGEIIAEYFNFQNLDSINKAYSSLLKINFFKELKKYQWVYEDKRKNFLGFIQLDNGFYTRFKKWIDLRHNFVHDINFNINLTSDKIREFDDDIVPFAHLIDYFILNKTAEKIIETEKGADKNNNLKS